MEGVMRGIYHDAQAPLGALVGRLDTDGRAGRDLVRRVKNFVRHLHHVARLVARLPCKTR